MHGRAREPAIDIVSIRWERVQLVLDARLGPDAAIDPAGLMLRRAHGGDRVSPTHVSLDADRLEVRFNVMQGPGLMPLALGRWHLAAGAGADAIGAPARPVRVAVPAAIESARNEGAFQLRNGTYRVTPRVTDPGASLALDVELDSETGLDSDAGWRLRVRTRVARALRSVRGAIFRLAIQALKVVHRRSSRRILFTSDSRAGLTGNLRDVHDRMVERGLDREYTLQTLFRSSVAHRRSLRDRARLPWLLAGAGVIVIDDFQPVIYRIGLEPDLRIVQLWHASGAFKTVGYSRVGKPGGPDPYSTIHKNYTHAIVSSEYDVPFYAEAFGIPEARVFPTGIPRMDRFFNEDARRVGLEAARTAFPESRGRMTILFAPTFRGDGPRTASYDIAGLDYRALHELAIEKDAVVIIRMHPFVKEPLGIPEAYRDRLLDGSAARIDVNDLLFAVDLLITDYSSIVFEYSTLGRPMLFFAYDLDDYVASRDFYVPFESFVPGRIVRTLPDLLEAIRHDDYEVEKVAAFATRHFAHLDGGSTDRVIDELILGS